MQINLICINSESRHVIVTKIGPVKAVFFCGFVYLDLDLSKFGVRSPIPMYIPKMMSNGSIGCSRRGDYGRTDGLKESQTI